MTPDEIKRAADRAEAGAGQPKRGRPSSYTQAAADIICERLAGGESLRAICADPAMPSTTAVRRWLADAERDDFRRQYARAREEQADQIADEIIEIADTEPDAQKARVRIDARKWVAGKMAPKKYGDRVNVDHSGQIATKRADEMTDDELAAIACGSGAPSSAASLDTRQLN